MSILIVILLMGITLVVTEIFTERRKNNEMESMRREHTQSVWDITHKYDSELSAMERAHMDRTFEDEKSYLQQINILKQEVDGLIKEGRKDAVKRSKQVVSGQVYEQISPLVPGFPYELRDARHVGSPLDFIIFRGLSGSGDIEIVFLEIKTGGSTLNSNERRVKRAVEAGRVKYDVFHPDLDQNIEDALEASVTPIRHELTNPVMYSGELVVPDGVVEKIVQQFNDEPTETLTCGHCKKKFSRPITPGRKPMFCPNCRGAG